MFAGKLQWDIFKKIRKRTDFEVLIFYYRTRYKEKHKSLPESFTTINSHQKTEILIPNGFFSKARFFQKELPLLNA
jgi:hypothetical protein